MLLPKAKQFYHENHFFKKATKVVSPHWKENFTLMLSVVTNHNEVLICQQLVPLEIVLYLFLALLHVSEFEKANSSCITGRQLISLGPIIANFSSLLCFALQSNGKQLLLPREWDCLLTPQLQKGSASSNLRAIL